LALEEPNNGENAIQVNGIDVLISDEVKNFAESVKVDYVSDLGQEGFSIGVEGQKCC
jgi:Fe-S cluster assembly iron-binding protein IscA